MHNMSSLTRGQRRLLRYASKDGKSSDALKRRRPEDIAPALKKRKQEQPQTCGDRTKETIDAEENDQLSVELLDCVQRRFPLAPRKLRKRHVRVINALSRALPRNANNNLMQHGSSSKTQFCVKRLEANDQPGAFSIAVLAAMERRRLYSDALSDGASMLVLLEVDADATSFCQYVKATYGSVHVLLLDGSRFPTFPTTVDKDGRLEDISDSFADRVVLVVTSLQAFLATDGRSAIWKFIGSYVVFLKNQPNGISDSMEDMKEEERDEFLKRLCEKRWHCLDHTLAAAVVAPSRNALCVPLADALTTCVPSAGKVEEEEVVEGKNCSEGKSEVSAKTGDKRDKTPVVDAMRDVVDVHYAVVEGTLRFQMLYTLLMNIRPCQGIVVHVATKEVCQFLFDVLYALAELPESLLLLADFEGPSTYASGSDTDEDRMKLCAKFDEVIANSSTETPPSGRRKDRVVLLSAFGLVPRMGTVFVQYDIIIDVANFPQFVSDVLTPAAYKGTTSATLPRLGGRTVSQSKSRQRRRSRSPVESNSSACPAHSPVRYRHILLMLRRNEVRGALRQFNLSARRLCINFGPMQHKPSATRSLLSVRKMQSLHNKQHAIQCAAYAAYRSTMLLYSIINDAKEVYDERRVDLKKMAQEFGYEEAPLLDLRTRDTAFRPKEDIYRAACERALRERGRLLACASKDVSGEASQSNAAEDSGEQDK
uniref:Uncharacterized protein n=1 Tax=Trypanosoma congolense (strain IL3000) TaxID=1068625 RepID=G0UYP6_TRYCI|nr:conserved hypothetical protein [Trypanosoma congolense IL3000]